MQDKADAVKEVRNGEITFEHVDFSYAGEGGNLSLKDINLHIKSGQTVGIRKCQIYTGTDDPETL